MSEPLVVDTLEALYELPEGTVIRCEIEEYHGVYELTNLSGCCDGWHTFTVIDGRTEIIDDFTPELPVEVIGMTPPEGDE